ncbi:MAG: BMP family lipoprotein [Dethiobacteria bacterium]|nr:BMP family ABC transporter substrate-binding protein [Bacillota bacterium]MDW7728419.1 BMP family ABC transporter substrate-binding protein [Bacillota bacterium]
MKKWLVLLLAVVVVFAVIGCGGADTPPVVDDGDDEGAVPETGDLRVGMVTDAGTIDDKSFNQGTWEGILLAASDFNLETRYLQPGGTTEADYINEIGNLVDAGFMFVVCPGFKFETAIYDVQDRYPDAKFVLIDGYPHAGDWEPVVKENVVSIFFAEHESGFLAGVATALQLGEGEVGFIGGMEIPPVQKFSWGFQQGILYANENHGTQIVMNADNFIYQGTFEDVAAGQVLAATMFDKGVDAIFAAAGGVGVGAINEAKTRAAEGQEVWIIGVDVDQYTEGIYEGNNSIILTSAMKYIDVAAYDMIEAELNGEFPGGQILMFDATNFGIGIPHENPNLDPENEGIVAEVFAAMQAGSLVVSDVQGDLFK